MDIEYIEPIWGAPSKPKSSSKSTGEKMVGTWWIGADGNVWTADAQGVKNKGKYVSGSGNHFETNLFESGSYNQQDDPNPPQAGDTNKVAGTTTGTGTGRGTTPKILDTAELASLDAYLARLGVDRDQAIAKAALTRDANLAKKKSEREKEEGKYKANKLSTLQDFSSALTDTNLNTRNTLENLMSSLSTLGLGGSRALTRQLLDAANMSNRKANATQAKDTMNLDSSWNEYDTGYNDDVLKIGDQYGYDAGEANKAYYTGQQNTLYKKGDVYGDADQLDQRGRVMKEADDLTSFITGSTFLNPQYTGKSRAMATPELGDYTQNIAKYNTTGIGNAPGQSPAGVPGNAAIKAIAVNDKDLGVKKKDENNLGYGV